MQSQNELLDLPQFCFWKPSRNKPDYIEVKIASPIGGNLINWISVKAHKGDSKKALDAAHAFIEKAGGLFGSEWMESLATPTHLNRGHVWEGSGKDVIYNESK